MPKKNPPQKNQLRIIGGQWRGRKLAIADVPGLRPTGDRIRETLFNWLMADIVGSRCLDLFAGSGALGLESLSRGAASTLLLEKHPSAVKQLKANCQLLKADNALVFPQDTLAWLEHPTIDQESVDIVFIDPPFSANLWDTTIEKLKRSGILADKALIYIESPKNQLINTGADWENIKEKIAGDIYYRLYQNHLAINM